MSERKNRRFPHFFRNAIIGVVLVLLFLLILIGYNPTRDRQLESKFADALQQFKADDAIFLDLRKVIGNEWSMICIQDPYIDEASFEAFLGRDVPNYEALDDSRNAFWIFYNDETIKSVQVLRGQHGMNERSRDRGFCTTMEDPFLYASYEQWHEHRWKAYFLGRNNPRPANLSR